MSSNKDDMPRTGNGWTGGAKPERGNTTSKTGKGTWTSWFWGKTRSQQSEEMWRNVAKPKAKPIEPKKPKPRWFS